MKQRKIRANSNIWARRSFIYQRDIYLSGELTSTQNAENVHQKIFKPLWGGGGMLEISEKQLKMTATI